MLHLICLFCHDFASWKWPTRICPDTDMRGNPPTRGPAESIQQRPSRIRPPVDSRRGSRTMAGGRRIAAIRGPPRHDPGTGFRGRRARGTSARGHRLQLAHLTPLQADEGVSFVQRRRVSGSERGGGSGRAGGAAAAHRPTRGARDGRRRGGRGRLRPTTARPLAGARLLDAPGAREGRERRRRASGRAHCGNLSRSFFRCCRATSTHSFSVATVAASPMYRSHCAIASRGSSFS